MSPEVLSTPESQAAEEDYASTRGYLVQHFNSLAAARQEWLEKGRYYHDSIEGLMARMVRPRSAVLALGCGTGSLLQRVNADPATSVGVDISPGMIQVARDRYPQYQFLHGDAERLSDLRLDQLNAGRRGRKFDYILMVGVIGYLEDIAGCFQGTHPYCSSDTRLIVTHYNLLWEPILKLSERLGWKMPQETQNWLSMNDLRGLLRLADYDIEMDGTALLLPKNVPPLSDWINEVAPRLPLLKELCLVSYFSARWRGPSEDQIWRRSELSCSVIVPCRNEVENIEAAVRRIPNMGSHTEIIFVDGSSTDGTVKKIEEMIERYAGQKDIRLVDQIARDGEDPVEQTGGNKMLKLGKGDAVRKGFDVAHGDVLMILDADLTVQPEDLPKFFLPLADGKARLTNGCRLVYPMEDQAMRFVNLFGNKVFSWAFSWLLDQPIKDTLCGTKALLREDYESVKNNRSYFGDIDPFGDFDLLFGAARLKLAIVDVPIRYRRRVAGVSKVSVLSHGVLLARMVLTGFRKLKLEQWLRRAPTP